MMGNRIGKAGPVRAGLAAAAAVLTLAGFPMITGTAQAEVSAEDGARAIGYAVTIARQCPGWRVVEQSRMAEAGLMERSEDWSRLAPGGAVHEGYWDGMEKATADLAADPSLCRSPFTRPDRRPDLLQRGLEPDASPLDQGDEPIGSARKEADGTIVLDLATRTQDGGIVHSQVRYGPADPGYALVAAHVGPIPAGGEVLVRPFPETLESEEPGVETSPGPKP